LANNIALNAAIAAAVAIAFAVAIVAILTLATAVISIIAVAVTAVTAAIAAPPPSPPLSSLLQPPPMSPCLQHSCKWLVVESSVTPHLLRCPPFKFVSPHNREIVYAFATRPPSPFANHSCPKH
jgi:hypothetical protein